MAVAAPFIAAAWASATAAAASLATALTFGSGLAAGLTAWSQVATFAALGASLLMKPPGLASQGQQVNIQLAGPNAPIPVIVGRSGTQGTVVYRDTYSSKKEVLTVDQVLSLGPINGVTGFSVMGRSTGYSGNPHSGVATITSVSGVNMVQSKLFREQGFKFAHRKGLLNDSTTLSGILGEAVAGIGSSDGMAGFAHTVLRLKLDEKQLNFPSGFPDDPINVVEGMLCYDPRLDSTYGPGLGSGPHRIDDLSTRTWSENPYIVGLQFVLGWRGATNQVMAGLGADLDDINLPAFVNAANIADQNGWKAGGGFTTADNPWPVLTNIIAAGGGVPLNLDGQISVFVNSLKVSTFSIRSDEVLGSRTITTSTPITDRANRGVPSVRSEAHKWEMIAGEAVTDASWLAADRGDLRTVEVAYPFVQNFAQAHQLIAYHLCNAREFLEVELTVKPRALGVEVGQCIDVALPEYAAGQKWIVLDKRWDPNSKTVSLTLKSETAEKHAFALGQSQVAPAPPTLIDFDPTNPAGPGVGVWTITDNKILGRRIFDITPEPAEGEPPLADEDRIYEERDNSVIPAIVVSGSVDDPNVAKTIIQVRQMPPLGEPPLAAEDGWAQAAEANQTVEKFVLAPMRPVTTFEVAVVYQTNRGAFSQRVVIGTVTTAQDEAGAVAPGTIDWTRPDGQGPIVGRPPVLNPQNPAYLDGSFFRYGSETLGEVVARIQGETANAVASAANAVVVANDALTNADGTLGNAVTNLNQLVANTIANAGTLGSRINAVEIISNSSVSRLTNVENVSANAIARISTLETTGSGPDGQTATRITNLESNSVTAFSQINSLQTVTTNNAISLASQISGLRADFQGASTTANARILTAEQTQSTNAIATASRISGVESNFSSALSTANSRITTAEQTQATANSAITSQLTSLSGTVSSQGTTISGYNTRFDNVDIAIGQRATVSSVTALGLTVNSHTGSISTLTSLTSTLDGKIEAKQGVVLNVNGYLSGYTLANNGQSSVFAVQADAFRLTSGANQSSPFSVIGSTTYMDNAVFRGQVDVKSASSGERVEITNTGIKVYGSNNVLRVQIGIL